MFILIGEIQEVVVRSPMLPQDQNAGECSDSHNLR